MDKKYKRGVQIELNPRNALTFEKVDLRDKIANVYKVGSMEEERVSIGKKSWKYEWWGG